MKYLKKLAYALLPLLASSAWGYYDFKNLEDKIYYQLGGAYISNNNFHGGGGAVRVGYNVSEYHHFELEVDFLFEQGSTSSSLYNFDVDYTVIGGSEIILKNCYVTQGRRVNLDMFPIMLNYRYELDGSTFVKNKNNMPWWGNWGIYLGGGVGANIIYSQDKYTFNAFAANAIGGTPVSKTYSNTEVEFVGQVFAGLSYNFTRQLAINAGGRLLFTAEQSFGDIPFTSNNFTTPGMNASEMSWLIEGAIVYTW